MNYLIKLILTLIKKTQKSLESHQKNSFDKEYQEFKSLSDRLDQEMLDQMKVDEQKAFAMETVSTPSYTPEVELASKEEVEEYLRHGYENETPDEINWESAADFLKEEGYKEFNQKWQLVKKDDSTFYLYVNDVLAALFEVSNGHVIDLFFEATLWSPQACLIWNVMVKGFPMVKLDIDSVFSLSNDHLHLKRKGAVGYILGKAVGTSLIQRYAHYDVNSGKFKTIH